MIINIFFCGFKYFLMCFFMLYVVIFFIIGFEEYFMFNSISKWFKCLYLIFFV